MGSLVFVAVGGICRIKVTVGVGVIEGVQVGSGVMLGVNVGGIIAAVWVAAAPAVWAIIVLSELASSVGPATIAPDCETADVCTEAAPAVNAMAVLNEEGSSVGISDGESTGAQENPSSAATTIHPTLLRLLMA
jgi:hypothetical protein